MKMLLKEPCCFCTERVELSTYIQLYAPRVLQKSCRIRQPQKMLPVWTWLLAATSFAKSKLRRGILLGRAVWASSGHEFEGARDWIPVSSSGRWVVKVFLL